MRALVPVSGLRYHSGRAGGVAGAATTIVPARRHRHRRPSRYLDQGPDLFSDLRDDLPASLGVLVVGDRRERAGDAGEGADRDGRALCGLTRGQPGGTIERGTVPA